jgi:hypothetical protein
MSSSDQLGAWFVKKAAKRGSSKRRWFVVRRDTSCVLYFENDTAKVPLGAITFTSIQEVVRRSYVEAVLARGVMEVHAYCFSQNTSTSTRPLEVADSHRLLISNPPLRHDVPPHLSYHHPQTVQQQDLLITTNVKDRAFKLKSDALDAGLVWYRFLVASLPAGSGGGFTWSRIRGGGGGVVDGRGGGRGAGLASSSSTPIAPSPSTSTTPPTATAGSAGGQPLRQRTGESFLQSLLLHPAAGLVYTWLRTLVPTLFLHLFPSLRVHLPPPAH